ncbi:agamous-like MADS-box protein AGL82 [Gastrolobium bilobum]|uniref:agamous-like MADS-box protein AGL82 n=1 Tax=Gastrolobium bilobum TaxID=150636 RepID=UPI002AB0F6EE|nr:agamous-like MADS-box protein AGL82 [Gastrolobium bilobum]
MGRSRTTFKRIPNDGARKATSIQRRKGLMKKVSKFSTMCGVEACLIVYDENGDAQPMTWPRDPIKAHSIIDKYERQKNEKPLKTFDLEDFFKNKKNMVEAEISRVNKDIFKTKYPTCHPSFNNLGEEQLEAFIATLDDKIGACDQRINMLKNEHKSEANICFIQNMAQKTGASYPSQLNYMEIISESQHIPIPASHMKQLNNGNIINAMFGSNNGVCNQRIDMQNELHSEANVCFIQNMAQKTGASYPSQLNYMEIISESQHIPIPASPMKQLNNGNIINPYPYP